MKNNEFTFEAFIAQEKNNLPINQQEITSAKQALNSSLNAIHLVGALKSNSKATEFKNELVKDVTSLETIKNISNMIGVPEKDETENEFVERAMSKISKYLDKRFK